jgi:hypothetical protein
MVMKPVMVLSCHAWPQREITGAAMRISARFCPFRHIRRAGPCILMTEPLSSTRLVHLNSACLGLAFLLVGLPICAMADPAGLWVAGGGGAKNDKTRAVTFDREGNVFLAGETTDNGVFGELKREGLGGMDFFLAKVSKDGRFLWVRSLGGSLVDRGYGVATDSAGNAYVTGHFQSIDATWKGGSLANQGDYDVFVAKYSPQGEPLWIRTAGGKGYDYGHGVAVDSAGDVIVTGAVAGEAQFDGTTVNAGSSTRPIFCAKYSKEGELRWVKTTIGRFSGSGHGVAVDASDAIYIGGSGGGQGSLGGKPLEITGGQAGVVLKLTPQGDAVWTAAIAGQPSAGFHEITVDGTGRVWCAGMFKGSLKLASGEVASTGDKDSDGFLAHFSPDGVFQWARVVQGPATDYCLGVATDGSGRSFVTGEFSAKAAFAGRSLESLGATDIFTAALTAAGDVEWLLPSGGAKGDNAYTMAWHPSGRLVIAGACVAPADFGGKPMASPGGAEAYGAVLVPAR